MLGKIQAELRAPKSAYNVFGKYKYRSCEDILEAVKPLLLKHGALLTISDEIVLIGERYYVKATVTLHGESTVSVSAFARESLTKKGMDDSQITGTASSYARKYALNGLFLIDDAKDADTNESQLQADNAPSKPTKADKIKAITSIDALAVWWAGLTPAEQKQWINQKEAKKAELLAKQEHEQ